MVRWKRREDSKMVRSERFEGSEVASWERWESNEATRCGRLLVLFKTNGCKMGPRFHLLCFLS